MPHCDGVMTYLCGNNRYISLSLPTCVNHMSDIKVFCYDSNKQNHIFIIDISHIYYTYVTHNAILYKCVNIYSVMLYTHNFQLLPYVTIWDLCTTIKWSAEGQKDLTVYEKYGQLYAFVSQPTIWS